jgi:hypothetical protein
VHFSYAGRRIGVHIFANSSIMARLKAGMSEGRRAETMFPSTTASSSTHSAPGVAQIGLDRGPRSNPAAPRHAGFDHRPWTVANNGYGLFRIEERFHESHGLRLHPQPVGIHNAARQMQGVEIARLRDVEVYVNRQFFAPVGEIPRSNTRGTSAK